MSALRLTGTAKPLTFALATLLMLTLISTASAAQTISATYSLSANTTTSINRQYSLTGLRTFTISESRNASTTADGTVTVTWTTDGRQANGSITVTRDAVFQINMNGTKTGGTETETSTITFSGTGSEEALGLLGPLRGPTSGTLENITINGQTYQAVHVYRNVTNSYTATGTENFTKTDNGRTVTVTVNKSVTRDISATANLWFSKTSGILLKSVIQGSITMKVSITGTITGPFGGTENFSMTATFTDTFSRNVIATSVTGLSG